jgi:transposase
MWTKESRRRYDRSGLRYESDLTDDEWAEIAPLLPPAKPGGNKRTVDLREVVNGLMYILSTGCQWRASRRIWRSVVAPFVRPASQCADHREGRSSHRLRNRFHDGQRSR